MARARRPTALVSCDGDDDICATLNDVGMTRGQLPKAYLRLDPDVDQKHPDNLDAFIRLMCAANRQSPRGWFKARSVLETLFGKLTVQKFYARGDVTEDAAGRVYLEGWDPWQEGDMTVADRMARLRNRGVTTPSHDRNSGVTEPSPDRSTTSEASRRLGVKALDALEGETARAEIDERGWDQPETEALTWLARHGCDIRPGNGYHQKLILAVENHGINAVIGMFDRLEGAGVKRGDIKGYLFGAIDALNGKPDLRGLEREDRADEEAARLARSIAKTKALTAERERQASQ